MATTVLRCARLAAFNGWKTLQTTATCRSVEATRWRGFSQSLAAFSGRKYTDKHEWIKVEGNIGTIGISDYAQDALGDIVYAQLPDEGMELEKDDECGALESVKAASELYCPLSGTVATKNTAVEEKPALINTSCYDEGWLFKVELAKPSEVDGLMDEEAYKAFLASQD